MAKLPPALVKQEKSTLRNLPIGQTGFVAFSAMQVDSELNCFLKPDATYALEKTIFLTLQVTRNTDGFHVALLGHWDWEPGAFDTTDWFPVVSLTERYDPTVDRFR